MVEKEIRHFSLEQICRSGQCFRMENIEEHESTDSCENTGEHGMQVDMYTGFWQEINI